MKKLMLLLSFMCLCLLVAGTALKIDNIIFWLASDSSTYQYGRIFLALAVLVLFFTDPPHRAWLRISTGLVAVAVSTWAINSTFAYTMNVSDTICFLATSIALGIAVLEREVETYSARKNSFVYRNSFLGFNRSGA